MATPFTLNELTEVQALYNESQTKTRNAVERSYGVIKRRFPVLSTGMKLKLETGIVQKIIVACCILHNIAVDAKDPVPPIVEGFDQMMAETEIPPDPVVRSRQPTNERNVRGHLCSTYFHKLAQLQRDQPLHPDEVAQLLRELEEEAERERH